MVRFFATDARALSPYRTVLGDLVSLFGENSSEEGVHYLGLGLRGYGLQSRSLEYLLDAKNLRLVLSLPWDRAYGDPEEERVCVETAFHLAYLCLTYRPEEEHLTLFLSEDTFFWSLTQKGETLKEGAGMGGLLDALQISDEDIPRRYWQPV
jgi:hypothetical protein